MVVFPNCKINLGLSIVGKRTDGFHDLETVFYPIAINDVLEIIAEPSTRPAPLDNDGPPFSTSGLAIAGNSADNLCIKAYHLLKERFPDLPPVNIHLHKAIPMGAGLGGGSADGAFTLMLLNDLFSLGISTETLAGLSLKLGSDCPFFIYNLPCIATGRGEMINPFDLDLSNYSFTMVNAGIQVNTGWAFSQLNLEGHSRQTPPIKETIQQPISSWRKSLVNDFERPVFEKYPLLSTIKEVLYQQGALYASMTGSGSTIFGIFEKNQAPAELEGMPDVQVWRQL